MIFSTYQFIFVFLPIVFMGYFILNKLNFNRISKIWLVFMSFVFYYIGSPDFFPFFMGSVFVNYIIGCQLSKMSNEDKGQKRFLFAIGMIVNIALLGYYKYTDFFIQNYNYLAGQTIELLNIALPIGISFFTFQLIAFLVDSYRGETKEYDIVDYLLFITFFPQLIVGPIVHHAEMVPQFEDKENQKINWDNIAKGLFLFSIGIAKKIMLADPLISNAQSFFDNIVPNLNMLESWFSAIEYTIAYYFDMSGYADMAIGLGLMFNIIIPPNFNSPYKARNFQDYWRRWHITLSRFLGTYIFRGIFKKENKWRNFYFATMITFLVSGFWHGAGWTFVLWGIINGLLVCIASWMKQKEIKLPFLISFGLTQIGIVLLWIMFVCPTFSDVACVYKGLVNVQSLGSNILEVVRNVKDFMIANWYEGLITVIGIGICWFASNTNEIMAKTKRLSKKQVVIAAFLMFISLVNMDKIVQFLYFQF